jgi:hypothetical protein
MFVVDHMPAHRFAIDNDGVHNLVRPPDLATGSRVEQAAIPQRARQHCRHAKYTCNWSREYGGRIVSMHQSNAMLPNVSPQLQRRGHRRRRFQGGQLHVQERNACIAEFFESHSFGLQAGDMGLKSRAIDLERDLGYIPLDPTVMKFSHGQQNRYRLYSTRAAFSIRHDLVVFNCHWRTLR